MYPSHGEALPIESRFVMRILIVAASALLVAYATGVLVWAVGVRLEWWRSPMDYVTGGARVHELDRR